MTSRITLTDESLYLLCREYGEKSRYWKNKFAGLLPEVYRRHLYRKKGFESIFEFAAKLAGMSHEQVRLVLNLEKKFDDKPTLKSLLVNGQVSPNKLIRIASIATPDNQETLAQWTQTLSKNALDTLVRDHKIAQQDGLQQPLLGDESLPGHSKLQDVGEAVKIVEKLSPETQRQLLELIDKNINIDEIISTALKNRDDEIAAEKHAAAEETAKKCSTRHIPARIIRIINAEQGDKCAVPTCNNRAEEVHHELPFALTKNHDPYNLKKLCKAHHEIAHLINIKYLDARRAGTTLALNAPRSTGPPDMG